jgi:PKD repeat protein
VGTLGANGSIVLVPVKTGTYTFTLTCSNSAGTSPASTVTLTVTPQVLAGSSGGGALDTVALMGLAALGVGRLLRRRT